MEKKLLFSDIDGTLLKNDGTIDAPLAEKLRELCERGHGLILSSGRPLDSILTVQSYLNEMTGAKFADAYIIANNGALVYDCNRQKPVLEWRLSLETVDRLQQAARKFGIHIQTYTEDAIVCERETAEIAHYRQRIHLPLLLADRYTDVLTHPPYKMLSIALEGMQRQLPFKEYVDANFSEEVSTFFSRNEYMEIIHKDAGKGSALRFLCEYLQVPVSHSYAAGDSENDISMLEAAGHSFAMAGGDDKVKAGATHITRDDCEHAGLIEVIDFIFSS